MGLFRPGEGKRAARAARGRCAIPVVGCAVVLLLPAPVAVASAPGPGLRTVPRAAASPGSEAFGRGWEGRLSQRLTGVPGDGRGHAYGAALPLPPLFGHHGHHGPGPRHQGDGAGRAGEAHSGEGRDGPESRSRAGAPERTDDRDGSRRSGGPDRHADSGRAAADDGTNRHPDDAEPGGSGPPDPARSAGAVDGATGPDGVVVPEGGGAGGDDTTAHDRQPAGGTAGGDGLWSPAPVAPEHMAAGAAEPGRQDVASPQQGSRQRLPAGADASTGVPAAGGTPVGPLLPVLPLGAGLTSLGLGLAFLALRLRRG